MSGRRDEAVSEERAARCLQLVEQAGAVILSCDLAGRVESLNPHGAQIFDQQADELLGKPLDAVLGAIGNRLALAHETQLARAQAAQPGDPGEVNVLETELPLRSGARLVIGWTCRAVREPSGEVRGTVFVGNDISRFADLARSLEESERTFAELTEHLEQCVWIKEPSTAQTGKMAFVSSAFERIFGVEPETLHGRPEQLFELVDPQDLPRFKASVETQFERRYDVEYRVVRPSDGAVRWIWSRASPICDAGGRIVRLVGVSEDITERKAIEERVKDLNRQLEQMYLREQELSRTDPLTGLGNRQLYLEAVDRLLKRARRDAAKEGSARFTALILVDVDHFKQINDHYGHSTGDVCLQRVAQVLLACVREVDICTRPGGDEFAVLLPSTSSLEAAQVARRICQSLQEQEVSVVQEEPARLVLSVSCGVAAVDGLDRRLENRVVPSHLYDLADGALYRAKEAGRGRVEVASSDPVPLSPPTAG